MSTHISFKSGAFFNRLSRSVAGLVGLAMVLLADTGRSQTAVLVANLAYPTNGQSFAAPANIYVHAAMADTNLIKYVQYFANHTNNLGIATNSAGVLVTNLTGGNPFPITWSNVTAGAYSLTAVVHDRAGNAVSTAPVSITVTNPVVRPVVYIYSPTNNSVLVTPATLSLYARAVATTGTVVSVQFFANSLSLGNVTNSLVYTNISTEPLYHLTWTNVAVGSYSLTAVVADSFGNAATSSVVNFTVVTNTPPVPVHPSVGIYSPTNGTTFTNPTNVNIYARAVESTGAVATVQFFANSLRLGVVSNNSQLIVTNVSSVPLFPLAWANPPAGSYALTAVATDTNGYTATSSVVNITIVTNSPTATNLPYVVNFWYPTNNQSFAALSTIGVHALATDSNIVRTVQYFANGTSLSIVTNTSSVLLTNLSQDSPFYFAWSNVVAGSYALTAIALDSQSHTATSSVVNITVTNLPAPVIRPSVYLYSPTNGATFTGPTNVNLYARAVESTGLVATVQFFANSLSLGVVSNSSQLVITNVSSELLFPLAWANPPAGSYALTVTATDTNGYTATSSVVNITIVTNPVTPPPNLPFALSFSYPTNGETVLASNNVGVNVLVTDSNIVRTVQYLANGIRLTTVTNTASEMLTNTAQGSPFFFTWSNVLAGTYALTAIATDSQSHTATSSVVNLTVTNLPAPVIRPSVYLYSPTNGATFTGPTNVNLYARAAESTGSVATVQFFANSLNLGTVSNSSQVVVTNISSEPLFPLKWSNAPAGSYALTVIAMDTNGYTATSSVVNITVITNGPTTATNLPYVVNFWYPTNNQSFAALSTIGVHALATDSNIIRSVQYFTNGIRLSTITNTSSLLLTNLSQDSPFYFAWSNAPAGSYALTAIAIDSQSRTATSSVVNITVTNLPPAIVRPGTGIYSPTNGTAFAGPTNVNIYARATESNGVVASVQFFANSLSLGVVSNSSQVVVTNISSEPLFPLKWSNAPAGSYALTVIATATNGYTATSSVVNITIATNAITSHALPQMTLPAISLYAPDPVAIAGRSATSWYVPTTTASNYVSGANTATFLVHRDSATNASLTVYYSVNGSASNGVDYATIPGWVNLPAGQSYTLISIAPLSAAKAGQPAASVILSLLPPPVTNGLPVNYTLGSPVTAGAVILGENNLPIRTPVVRSLPDATLHISLPATNGLNGCLQISTNLIDWQPVCTNTVLKGSAQFVDPNGSSGPVRYYRIVPVPTPADY